MLYAIWGNAVNDIWAAGSATSGNVVRPVVLHFTGASWTAETIGGTDEIRGVFTTFTNVWAGGRDGVFNRQ